MTKIEAYKTKDNIIYETQEEAEIHEYKTSISNGVLTTAEQRIYDMVINGSSNQEIADNYDLQLVTVKKHLGAILLKYNVKTRVELIVKHYKNLINN